MKIPVHNHLVKENLKQFTLAAGRHWGDKGLYLPAVVDCKTGFIAFSDGETTQSGEQWKVIAVELEDLPGSGFSVHSPSKKKKEFIYTDLTPVAYAILRETIEVLNSFLNQLPKERDLPVILKELAELEAEEFLPTDEHFSKHEMELLKHAWFAVDRLEAEELLRGQQEGVYILRKDAFAQILEEGLGWSCLTLTYLKSEGRVIDYTLVKKEKGWLVYNDDPTLSGSCFPDLQQLLQSLGLKRPLVP